MRKVYGWAVLTIESRLIFGIMQRFEIQFHIFSPWESSLLSFDVLLSPSTTLLAPCGLLAHVTNSLVDYVITTKVLQNIFRQVFEYELYERAPDTCTLTFEQWVVNIVRVQKSNHIPISSSRNWNILIRFFPLVTTTNCLMCQTE